MSIKCAAVIGAGVMGSGIAAHLANAGINVFLLDIVPEGAKNRNVIAETALNKMLKADPAPFMNKRCAKLVHPGNLEDHFDLLAQADWIVEAIIENPKIKQDLYQRLSKVRKADSVISSNTSTIPLSVLTQGMPEDMVPHFMITHFFNPPRYMRLLEIVSSDKTDKAALAKMSAFCDIALGKGVVHCNDTPGFIANRIGTFWFQCAVNEALDLGLSVEEADLVMSKPIGIPKTGVFGLLDLVGLDLMPHVGRSMYQALSDNDAYKKMYREPEIFTKMISEGYTGRKGKGGFYRLNREGGKKVKEAINLKTGEYSKATKPQFDSVKTARKSLQTFLSFPDRGGQYAWKVLSQLLNYTASLVPEIAETIYDVDLGMKLGYNWKFGPFELIDKIGSKWFVEKLEADGIEPADILKKLDGRPFYRVENGAQEFFTVDGTYQKVDRADGVLLLSDIKLNSKPVLKNASASVWDIGDGVLCFEFTSKMNSIDPSILDLLYKTIGVVEKDYKALVIHNEGSNFSVGANIGLALFAANIALWPAVTDMVEKGQKVYKALKQSSFPVVGAPSGLALGGGCEVLLHCNHVQAHAETYMGLVEVGVGVVPAWGGCKEMLHRWNTFPKAPKGPMPKVAKAFEIISMATVAKSAMEAQELLYIMPGDGITMNKERLLFDAKQKALLLAENYTAPEDVEVSLPGETGAAALELAVQTFDLQGKITPHDKVVVKQLINVLTGGKTDITESLNEDELLELERSSFVRLAMTPGTIARIEHMLNTGRPLRN